MRNPYGLKPFQRRGFKGFWRKTVAKYRTNWFASTRKPHPDPRKVDHQFSSGLGDGTWLRYWSFATEEERDAFVQGHPTACSVLEDPCPPVSVD